MLKQRSTSRGRAPLAAMALLLALALPGIASAEPETWAYQSWNELMSPFCPGRSLADCPSPQADTLRSWILVQAAAGRSRAEVEAEVFEQYGDVVLAAPRAQGIGLTAYALPAAVFVAGGLLVVFFLRRQTAGAASGETEAAETATRDPELTSELERLVDQELSRQE